MKQLLLSALIASTTLGCNVVVEPVANEEMASLTKEVEPLSGYHHTLACSRFKFGKNPVTDSLFEFERVVGDEGVLAYGRHGVTLGVPNARAPSVKAAPFAGSEEEHTKRVLAYFTDECGLPKSQLGPADITTLMRAGGAVMDRFEGKDTPPEFRGYNTVLSREVDGIPVRGSYAWARFNGDGDVVSEEVYWPALSRSLLDDARRLKERLADTTQRAEIFAKLPEDLAKIEPEVNIYHSPHFQDRFEAYVTMAFAQDENDVRYLEDGTKLRFDFERDIPSMPRPDDKAKE